MRGSEETNRTGRRRIRRSAAVALATLLFLSLTVSPSRGSCSNLMLSFANVPDQRSLHVRPNGVVSIVGEYWTNDCFDTGGGGGACYGPGNERPIEDILVELIREDKTRKVLVAEGISAQGEYESWFLTFRVPDLPPGNYFIQAKERGSTGGGARLSLRVSPDAPTWP